MAIRKATTHRTDRGALRPPSVQHANGGGGSGAALAKVGKIVTRRQFALYAAAALSLEAALIHLLAAPGHARWMIYESFFLSCVLAQGLYGTLLLSPIMQKSSKLAQPLYLLGIVGNLAIVGLYILTRTRGIPLGPAAGHIEDAGILDMASIAAEVGLAGLLTMLLEESYRKKVINGLVVLGAVVWGMRLWGFLP